VTNAEAAVAIERRLAASRAALLAALEAVPLDLLHVPTRPGGWSPAQHADHVERAERAFGLLVRLVRAKGTLLPWTRRPGDGPPTIDFDYAGTAIRAPRPLHPRARPDLDRVRSRLERTRARTLRALSRRARDAGRGATWPHPAFGRLDATQWLAVAALHEDHHARLLATSPAS
jgi:hypothetical protein